MNYTSEYSKLFYRKRLNLDRCCLERQRPLFAAKVFAVVVWIRIALTTRHVSFLSFVLLLFGQKPHLLHILVPELSLECTVVLFSHPLLVNVRRVLSTSLLASTLL